MDFCCFYKCAETPILLCILNNNHFWGKNGPKNHNFSHWPPHLTLKPSKKNTTKEKNTKTNKEGLGPSETFFDNLAKKRAPKNTKIWGFNKPIFGKQMCVTKWPFLDREKTRMFQLSIVLSVFFLSFSNKNTKMLKPLFL